MHSSLPLLFEVPIYSGSEVSKRGDLPETYGFELAVESSHSRVCGFSGDCQPLFERAALLHGQLPSMVDLHPIKLLLFGY